MAIRIPRRHWVWLGLGPILLLPVVAFTPLNIVPFYILVVVMKLPISIQTGAAARPHPVCDHPLFLPVAFLVLNYVATWGIYLALRTVGLSGKASKKRHKPDELQ